MLEELVQHFQHKYWTESYTRKRSKRFRWKRLEEDSRITSFYMKFSVLNLAFLVLSKNLIDFSTTTAMSKACKIRPLALSKECNRTEEQQTQVPADYIKLC